MKRVFQLQKGSFSSSGFDLCIALNIVITILNVISDAAVFDLNSAAFRYFDIILSSLFLYLIFPFSIFIALLHSQNQYIFIFSLAWLYSNALYTQIIQHVTFYNISCVNRILWRCIEFAFYLLMLCFGGQTKKKTTLFNHFGFYAHHRNYLTAERNKRTIIILTTLFSVPPSAFWFVHR